MDPLGWDAIKSGMYKHLQKKALGITESVLREGGSHKDYSSHIYHNYIILQLGYKV